jgi:MoxR-like ATPase
MPENTLTLAELFKQGAKGFTKDLPQALPRPWDAPPQRRGNGKDTEDPPAPYLLEEKDPLANAAWVALLLRQPLLLTGDPGVGKTRFAEKLAADLGIGPPTRVQVKSATSGRDLLYRFDDLSRFRDATIAGAIARAAGKKDDDNRRQESDEDEAEDAQSDASASDEKALDESSDAERIRRAQRPLLSYVRMEGLGRAILRAAGPDFPVKLDDDFDPVEVFGEAIVGETLAQEKPLTLRHVFPKAFEGEPATRHSVVLIDELDKAPRDTPNDLLAEIERMRFRFDELGFEVEADPQYKPIVVITSNAERNLPDAFLRRCVFHHIETPEKDQMCKIAAARLGGLDPNGETIQQAWKAVIDDAWNLFADVRKGITEKRPGTAEFIALVAYLRATDDGKPLSEERIKAARRIFNKTKQDLATADRKPAVPAKT